MKNHKFKLILLSLFIAIIVMGIYDYARVKDDEYPLFTIKLTKDNSHKEYWVGPFYYTSRTTSNNAFEKLSSSLEVKFGPWLLGRKINYNYSSFNNSMSFIPVLLLNCEEEKQRYFSFENQDFYKLCLDNLSVSYKGKTRFIEQSITKKEVSVKQVLDEAKAIITNDKYKTYEYSNFNIIKCNAVYRDSEQIEELIITSKSNKQVNLCPSEPCTFTKTFKIVDIHPNHESEINHITVDQNGKYTTVAIKQMHLLELEEEKTYDFVFINQDNDYVENNNIEDLFEYLEIKEINLNDGKIIYNEDICI